MISENEWESTKEFLLKVCPVQSGRSNPIQRMTDQKLYELYKTEVPDARGQRFFNIVKRTLQISESNWDNFSCYHCMDLTNLQNKLLGNI